MSEPGNKQNEKKIYQKPSLRIIELLTDEVLAVGCKTQQITAVNNKVQCHAPSACFSKGS